MFDKEKARKEFKSCMVYIDDSKDRGMYVFSAIVVPVEYWYLVFNAIKDWRKSLNASDGIFMRKEFHATDFVGGRGRLSNNRITMFRRSQIFHSHFNLLATLKVRCFNVILDREDWAFERLLNRINRTMDKWGSYAVLFCDEGKEGEYTKLVRRMSVHNPVPSVFGYWLNTGKKTRNIPLDRIIEDPIFRDSSTSYLIQSADFCAYALLRREIQLPSKNKYRIHKAFDRLEPVCFKDANRSDPMGVIR